MIASATTWHQWELLFLTGLSCFIAVSPLLMWMGASQAMCYLSTSGRSKIIANENKIKQFLEFGGRMKIILLSYEDLLILCIRVNLVLIILTMILATTTALIGRQYANRSSILIIIIKRLQVCSYSIHLIESKSPKICISIGNKFRHLMNSSKIATLWISLALWDLKVACGCDMSCLDSPIACGPVLHA